MLKFRRSVFFAFVQTLFTWHLCFISCLIVKPRYLASSSHSLEWMKDVVEFDQIFISGDRRYICLDKKSLSIVHSHITRLGWTQACSFTEIELMLKFRRSVFFAFVQTLFTWHLCFISCLIVKPRYLASSSHSLEWMKDVVEFDQIFISGDRRYICLDKKSLSIFHSHITRLSCCNSCAPLILVFHIYLDLILILYICYCVITSLLTS